jgi:multiple sugar transport system substrate-binding protein
MRKARSIFSILFVLCFSFSVLAGCAPTAAPTSEPLKTEAPAQTEPAAPPTEVPKPTEASEPTQPPAAAKPFEGHTLNVLLNADHTWVPDQIPPFEEATGAKINILLANFEDLVTKFATSATAKSGAYDVVVSFEPIWLISGFIEPLDDRMSELDQADLMGLDMVMYQGKHYGLPYMIDNRVFLYNTDILKQAGFDAPPKTWDEFFDQAKTIKDKGILEYPIMMPWMQHEGEFCDISAWFKSAGGAFFNEAGDASAVNSAENVAALDFLKKLYDAGLVNPESLASKSFPVTQALAQGQAAFGTSWNLLTAMLDDPEQSTQVGKVKVALYPGMKEGMTGTFDGSEGLEIAADSKEKDLAWEFVKWITGKEMEKKTFLSTNILPTWYSLYEDPELLEVNANLPVLKEQRQSILYRPQTGWANEFSSTLQIAALEAITGAKSSQQALDEANAAIDAMMK